ncbi:MAG: hypothetical protein HY297_03600 [Thaumarchaeota archaeon]|nr:hypothetical protein [Nitrososphaerota archaeon]
MGACLTRVPLSSYPREGSKVFSLVARMPFTPLDVDIGRLARGEWDALRDRFRVWFIPRIEGRDDRPLCNFTVRKFDRESDVLLFMHLTVNLDAVYRPNRGQDNFVVGILCNDDVRARTALGTMLDNPPSFHERREIRLIESRWRRDPPALMYYLANVHSVQSASSQGVVSSVKVSGEASEDVLAMMKEGMGGWWRPEAASAGRE